MALQGRNVWESRFIWFAPNLFLGLFAKLQKASSCLSVRMERLGTHWTHFHEIWYLYVFRKYVENIHVSLNFDKNNVYVT
jgi:hypothetical protein